jgi:hypothetical protein
VDYQAFLSPPEPVVLPYFGGTRVDAPDRRYRVEQELAPGWWRFRIDGRRAVAVEPAAAGELSALPILRGHWAAGWVIASGRELGRIALPPDDEPRALSRVIARRWPSGDWLFDTLEFEDDAEVAAREALEHGRPLGALRHVVPSLRAAFGVALGMEVARELDLAVSVRELAPRVVAIADGGREIVREMFAAWIEQRRREVELARQRAEQAAATIRLANAVGQARAIQRRRDPRQRADDALDHARARMLSCVRIDRGARLDVTYEVDGTRIISLVDAETLQVIDPGICLSGAHRVLTLDAMPSVVREAIEEDHLNITRRP